MGETLVAEASGRGAPVAEVRELVALTAPSPPAPTTALGRCSGCGSDDVRRVSLVYEEGTHRLTTVSKTGGVGIVGGDLAVASATTATSGSRQALLAERLAPPVAKPTDDKGASTMGCFGVIVVAVIAATIWGVGGFLGGALVGIIGFAVIAGNGGFNDQSAVEWNTKQLPRLKSAWDRSVVCMRCGAITDPEPKR